MAADASANIAVQYANQVIGLVQQIKNIRAQAAEIIKVNGANPLVAQFWSLLKTTALAADGSLGTADGSPVVTNKIDTRVYTGLSRAVSSNDLAAGLQILVDEAAFCDGTQVNANASRPAQIDALAM